MGRDGTDKHRADVWRSTVADLGSHRFKGETEGETLAKILRDPVTPPSAVVPGLTRAFDAPLLKALSRDASKHFGAAAAELGGRGR